MAHRRASQRWSTRADRVAFHALPGRRPVYYRLLLSDAPLEDDLAARVVGAVWPAFAAAEETPALKA
jgi:hypothetical protein